VKYYKVREEEDLTVYKCTGTPVDCVKLALHTVVPRRPDVVIGGINHGDNSSVNVHYSGTMGVVIEGCLKGISSIGYSLCNHFADADFSSSLPYIRRITEQVLEHGLPLGICLNVNFPDTASLKGVRICRQTNGAWINEWKRSLHPRGGEYFWNNRMYKDYSQAYLDIMDDDPDTKSYEDFLPHGMSAEGMEDRPVPLRLSHPFHATRVSIHSIP
jgi:5'-nucleotidase